MITPNGNPSVIVSAVSRLREWGKRDAALDDVCSESGAPPPPRRRSPLGPPPCTRFETRMAVAAYAFDAQVGSRLRRAAREEPNQNHRHDHGHRSARDDVDDADGASDQAAE